LAVNVDGILTLEVLTIPQADPLAVNVDGILTLDKGVGEAVDQIGKGTVSEYI
jgi:hypothetical protein